MRKPKEGVESFVEEVMEETPDIGLEDPFQNHLYADRYCCRSCRSQVPMNREGIWQFYCETRCLKDLIAKNRAGAQARLTAYQSKNTVNKNNRT